MTASSRCLPFACTLLLILTDAAAIIAGDPPAVQRLFPPGAQRGSAVEIRITGKTGDGELRIISERDVLSLTLNEKRDGGTLTVSAEARPGVHWIRFANVSGATELLPFIVGMIPEVSEVEPNNRISEAQPAEMPAVTVNGVLEKSRDVDTYAVQLSAGQTLVAAMQANQILGSPMDAVLQVATERGVVVAQNHDDTGLDPRVTFTAPTDGIWYVRTFAFPSAPDSTIGFAGRAEFVYRLTLTTLPVVTHTTPVVFSTQQMDSPVSLHGWNFPDPVSVSLSSLPSDDVRPDSVTLQEGLALPFRVEGLDVPVVSEHLIQDGMLPDLPIAISGCLDSSVQDIYFLKGSRNEQIRLRVDARRYSSLLDPVISVLSEDGKVLKEADDISGDNPDSDLNVTLPADGTFKIVVQDRYQHQNNRFFYLLRAETVLPDWEAGISTTAGILPEDGKPLEVPVNIQRSNGFVGVISFRAEGLPQGVIAECPSSEKEGETSKAVKLKLSGVPVDSFQGPIRIVASVTADEMTTDRPVSFRTADHQVIETFFLTARAPQPTDTPDAAPESE